MTNHSGEFFGSHSFFRQELIPSIEKVGRRLVSAKTTYEHQGTLEYLYILDGRGEIRINGAGHALQRGTSLALMNFQLRQFLPEAGHPLQINYCRLKEGAMYAFWSCPYYQPPNFLTSHNKTSGVWSFPEEQREEIERLWTVMYDLQFQESAYAKQKQLYTLMEYLGYFHRLCYSQQA